MDKNPILIKLPVKSHGNKWDTYGKFMSRFKSFFNVELELRPEIDYRILNLDYDEYTVKVELISDKCKNLASYILIKWDLYKNANVSTNLYQVIKD